MCGLQHNIYLGKWVRWVRCPVSEPVMILTRCTNSVCTAFFAASKQVLAGCWFVYSSYWLMGKIARIVGAIISLERQRVLLLPKTNHRQDLNPWFWWEPWTVLLQFTTTPSLRLQRNVLMLRFIQLKWRRAGTEDSCVESWVENLCPCTANPID